MITGYAVGSTEPKKSISILKYGIDRITPQTVLKGYRLKDFPIVSTYATSYGAEPKETHLILKNSKYLIAGQSICCGKGAELPTVIAIHSTAPYGKPETTRLIQKKRSHFLAPQCGAGSVPTSVAPNDSLLGSEPEMSLPILENRHHPIVCQSVFGSKGGKVLPIVPTHTFSIRGEPQISCLILKNRADIDTRESIRHIKTAPMTFPKAAGNSRPRFGTDWQRSTQQDKDNNPNCQMTHPSTVPFHGIQPLLGEGYTTCRMSPKYEICTRVTKHN